MITIPSEMVAVFMAFAIGLFGTLGSLAGDTLKAPLKSMGSAIHKVFHKEPQAPLVVPESEKPDA